MVMIAIYLKEQTECYYFEKKASCQSPVKDLLVSNKKKLIFTAYFLFGRHAVQFGFPSVRLQPHKTL